MNDIEMPDAGNTGTTLPPGYEVALQKYVELSVLGMMGRQVEALKQRAEIEFPVLCSREYARYVSVNLEKQSLIVGTSCVELSMLDGPRRRIGEFLIIVSRNPSGFIFENLTPLENGFHHPHISSVGYMCMGSADDPIKNLITDGQFLDVVDNLWAALNMLNNERAHSSARINLWPLVEGAGQ